MANELKLSVSATFLKGSISDDLAVEGLFRDVTGTQFKHNIQSVGVGETDLERGDIDTSDAYMLLVNRAAAGTISVRAAPGAGFTLITMQPGDVAMFRCSPDPPRVISTAVNTDLEIFIIEA